MPPLWFLNELEDRKRRRDKKSRKNDSSSKRKTTSTRPASSSTAGQATRVGSSSTANQATRAGSSSTADQTTRVGSTISTSSRPATARSTARQSTRSVALGGHKKVDSGTTVVGDGKSKNCDRQRTFSGIMDGTQEGREEEEKMGKKEKVWKAMKAVFWRKKDRGEK